MTDDAPIGHATVWQHHEVPGYEHSRLQTTQDGWSLSGVAVLAFEGKGCRLDYAIECDPQWLTRSATVQGWVGAERIDVVVARDADGQWQRNGHACDEVSGCTDIDLNFSPSTNLLPIRRCNLAVGESVDVRAAWLRFPSFKLEPLEQSYTRLAPDRYRYESNGGSFVAELTVDAEGCVIDYGTIWTRQGSA